MEYPPLLVDGVAAVRSGRLRPSEWAKLCLDVIAAHEPALSAWLHVDPGQVLATAQVLDRTDWSKVRPEPRLAGAPLGVKDIFNTVEHPNSMGSETRKGYWPGNDARVVAWAKLQGAQILGKTTTAEFAVHAPPATVNPWDAGVIAGTSSTGSAVAVATGMVPAALGTQSAGSIGRPASYNGVVGFKPSFGLIPRTGVLKTCDTLDTVGWLTRSVADAGLLLDCLRVRGDNYPMVEAGLGKGERKVRRVALAKAPGSENVQPDVREKVETLARQLSNLPDIELIELDVRDTLGAAHATHRTIYYKALSYYFKRELNAKDLVSNVFKEIDEIGRSIAPAEYLQALETQEKIAEGYTRIFDDIDVMLVPTASGEPVSKDGVEPDDSNLIWTLVGAPAVTLPLLRGSRGLPVGVTFVGAKYSDYSLLRFAQRVMPDAVAPVVPRAAGAGRAAESNH